MIVRKATYDDIDRLMEIFESAKVIMRTSGNLEQWNGNYPTREIVCSDITSGNCYILCAPIIDENPVIIDEHPIIFDEHPIIIDKNPVIFEEHPVITKKDTVITDNDTVILGTMALIPGPDHTYHEIDGEWPDDEPYYVIHRIATATPGRNVARTLLDWAFRHVSEDGCRVIRIDTHRDNCIMKHILTKYGFAFCGVIRLDDGSPRDAYSKKAKTSTA